MGASERGTRDVETAWDAAFAAQVRERLEQREAQSLAGLLRVRFGIPVPAPHLRWSSEEAAGKLRLSGSALLQSSEQAHGLFVLTGAAGAGKTTTLVSLASSMLEEAEAQPPAQAAWLPVVLSLETWRVGEQTLAGWLLQTVCSQYEVSAGLALRWSQAGRLVCLLDDLEELSPDQRDALLAALVTFGTEQPSAHVVLGCEPDELERLARHGLQPATASIAPLEPEEVGAYLKRLDGHAKALREAAERSQVLAEALRTPLALAAGVLAYSERPRVCFRSGHVRSMITIGISLRARFW